MWSTRCSAMSMSSLPEPRAQSASQVRGELQAVFEHCMFALFKRHVCVALTVSGCCWLARNACLMVLTLDSLCCLWCSAATGAGSAVLTVTVVDADGASFSGTFTFTSNRKPSNDQEFWNCIVCTALSVFCFAAQACTPRFLLYFSLSCPAARLRSPARIGRTQCCADVARSTHHDRARSFAGHGSLHCHRHLGHTMYEHLIQALE